MVSHLLLDIVIHAHNTYSRVVRLTVAFAWVGWWLAFIACIVIFATDMSASELLQAEKAEQQREADLYRSRFRGEPLNGMEGNRGGRVHKGDFFLSYC